MKVKDLEVGELYRCKLSNAKVLIIMTEEHKTHDKEGEEITIDHKKAGKIAMYDNTSHGVRSTEFKYMYIELHDNQLTKLT